MRPIPETPPPPLETISGYVPCFVGVVWVILADPKYVGDDLYDANKFYNAPEGSLLIAATAENRAGVYYHRRDREWKLSYLIDDEYSKTVLLLGFPYLELS